MPMSPMFAVVDELNFNTAGAATVNVPAGAATTVIKNRRGRLVSVLVATLGTQPTQIFDNTTGAGLLIGYIPANTPAGTVYQVQMPAFVGITALGVAGSPQLTVCYS